MDTQTFTGLLLFLGAIVAAVLYVLDRSGKRLNESIPADVLPLFMGLLALAETLAKETPTTADDELIARIKAALDGNAPDLPADPEAQG